MNEMSDEVPMKEEKFLGALVLLSIADQEIGTRKQLLELQEELKFKNRFFPNNIILKQIDSLVNGQHTILPKGTILYRARTIGKIDESKFLTPLFDDINKLINIPFFNMLDGNIDLIKTFSFSEMAKSMDYFSDDAWNSLLGKYREDGWWGYSEIESDAPPKDKSRAGIINPDGISYLYVSGDERTAALEVRPVISQYVSIAKIVVEKDIRLFDFTSNYKQEEYENHAMDAVNWFVLSDLFSQPNYSGDEEYLVTQYISEYIKNIKDDNGNYLFDGLCFGSSLNQTGLNYALYDTSENRKYRITNSKLCRITDLNGTLEQWLPIDEKENIFNK